MNPDFMITNISRVILVGKEEYPETMTQFSSNRRYNELVFKLSGRSTVYFGSQVLQIEPNTVWFMPAVQVSDYRVVRHEFGDCIDVFFSTDIPVSDEAFAIQPFAPNELQTLFKKIFSVWVSKSEGYRFETCSLLYKIFAQLQKQSYLPSSQYAVIQPALSYISDHFLSEKISAEQLAKLCGISYSYLKKTFLKKFGMPPVKYMIWLKINYACDLLQTEHYSIARVAQQCSYQDVYFFSRQFKDYMGITPSEFIKKYKSSK